MMQPSDNPVISGCSYCLAHVPDLVRYGSKPSREIAKDPSFDDSLSAALRPFPDALRYPPNQTYVGNLTPEALAGLPRPWFARMHGEETPPRATGAFGEIVGQDIFYALLRRANVLRPALVELCGAHAGSLHAALAAHPALRTLAGEPWEAADADGLREEIARGDALALRRAGELAGCVRGDRRAVGRGDRNLDAQTLLEALCTKASGSLALATLFARRDLDARDVDFIVSCGEEAAGDRYQRGGGGMAKAIGEMSGCANASGMDIKNFCAAPASALVTAGALVKAGLYERVAVVAGGSLAKLGMKCQAFLDANLPILGDCLASMAFLVTRDDGSSPVIRLEPGATGIARIGASAADEAVYRQLVLEPLQALGLRLDDVDKFAPELHNPEIMEHSGSGDVVRKNYRMIAALAVLSGEIEKADMASFVERAGMVGYAPPQGHIPSGVPYIGHAARAMSRGEMRRAMFVCKASLFLNRLTELYDGVSFVLEANPRAAPSR